MSYLKSIQVKGLFTICILILDFCISSKPCLAQTQEVEPNNTFATADTINILSNKTGTVQLPSDENDYFKTVLPADGTLKVYVQGKNNGSSSTYLGIYVYDKNKQQLRVRDVGGAAIAVNATAYDTITVYGAAADTFYFRLQAFGTLSYNIKYNIVDVTPNDVEPNNTFAQAIPLNQSEIKQGHVGYLKNNPLCGGIGNCTYVGSDTDYYRAVINTYGKVRINLKANDVYGDPSINTSSQLSLLVFDRRKDNGFLQSLTINTADGTSKTDSAILYCQGPDTLYFRLYSQYAYGYELSYTTSDTSSISDEPNNTFATATRIALKDTIKTNIGYETGGVADNFDHYRTVLPSRGTVKVYVQATSTGGGGYLYAGIYDKRMASGFLSGKYIGGSSSFPAGGTIIDSITINCTIIDTLYIVWQSNGCFRYSFRIELINRAPSSNFEFTKTGNLYEFTNNSLNGTTYKWDFGNSTTSTLPNPPLKSFSPGFYTVKLIANNNSGCNFADTSVKIITIKGIERYTPMIGGNGNLLFTVYGGGFNSNTVLKLKRGSTVYTDSGRSINSYGNIYTCIMDMHNAPVGLYDVDIVTTDSTYHFPNGFSLEFYRDSLQIEIVGRDVVRAADTNSYKIRVHNHGNTIAGVTEVFILFPENTELKLLDSLLVLNVSSNINQDTISENLSVTNIDGYPISGIIRGYYITGIPAGTYTDLNFSITFPIGSKTLYAWVRGPFTGSPPKPFASDCIKAIGNYAWASINLGLDVIPAVNCNWELIKGAWTALDIAGNTAHIILTGQKPDDIQKGKVYASYIKTMRSIMKKCAGELAFLTGVGTPVAPYIEAISIAHSVAISGGDYYSALNDVSVKCNQSKYDNTKKNIDSRASLDPNAISGPTGVRLDRYVNRNKKAINYTVFFENLQTATLPAQKVIVLDTLDNNAFDFKTLNILSLGIGKKSYSVPVGNKEFLTDLIIDSSISVRLNIKLDTTSRILKATFKTIDRATGLPTTNPLAGFLPPNIHSPEGDGYFTYSIELKDNLSHGTVINNRASIIFDNNNPILTNTWTNTIDNVKPISQITSAVRINDTTAIITSIGSDVGSGIEHYKLFSSRNGAAYEFLGNISDSVRFYGQKDSTYSFYVIGVDSVGNIETKTASAEATVTFSSPLPVTMLPLKATKEVSGNKLIWATVSEQNNKGFFVERTENGRDFSSIGFVLSQSITGNSSTRLNYAFADVNVPQKVYYRLKQTDNNNRFAYSNTVNIDRGKAVNISVYPNPTKNEIWINSDRRLTAITITDLNGKIIKRLLPSATNRYALGDVQNGIYVLELLADDFREQVKIVVVR